MASSKEIVIGLVTCTRPLEWVKTFGNMIIAVAVAMYLLYNGFAVQNFNALQFIYGFIAVGPLLWGGLYLLNDWTDRERDRSHEIKCKRPIANGVLPTNIALAVSVIMIAAAFAIGFTINLMFVLCLLAMLANQLLYTMEPIHLKSKPILDLISGSMINPTFRFYSGWSMIIPMFNAPILALMFVVGFQFGGYTLYRMSSKKQETYLRFKSSVVMFGEKTIKRVAYLAIALAGLAYIAMPLFGILPLHFLWLLLLTIFFAPTYWHAARHPEKIDLMKTYHYIYVHYVIFIICFAVAFLLT